MLVPFHASTITGTVSLSLFSSTEKAGLLCEQEPHTNLLHFHCIYHNYVVYSEYALVSVKKLKYVRGFIPLELSAKIIILVFLFNLTQFWNVQFTNNVQVDSTCSEYNP